MLAALGDTFEPFSWAHQIAPELLWLTAITRNCGYRKGVELARRVGRLSSDITMIDPKPTFALMSSFRLLSEREKEEVRNSLTQTELDLLTKALFPLSEVWPSHPLAFLANSTLPPRGKSVVLSEIGPLLSELYDRTSKESTLGMATLAYLRFDQGKLFLSEEVAERRSTAFIDIEDYPLTDASKSAGAFFRSMAPMFLIGKDGVEPAERTEWRDEFWDALSNLGDCLGNEQDIPENPSEVQDFEAFAQRLTHLVCKDLRLRQANWGTDLSATQQQEVILALLARQATLTLEVACSPSLWNPNVGPVLLRAMADCHITLIWLLGNVVPRTELYVKDGLSAVKLEIAHRREQLKTCVEEEARIHNRIIENLEGWLDAQQFEFLTEVNLGSWSGKSTRQMAEEAGCIDFYNYVFQPFSTAVHSTWAHVGRLNVEICLNPAHNCHFLPIVRRYEPDPYWGHLAVKYFAKSLRAFDAYIAAGDLSIASQHYFDTFVGFGDPPAGE